MNQYRIIATIDGDKKQTVVNAINHNIALLRFRYQYNIKDMAKVSNLQIETI